MTSPLLQPTTLQVIGSELAIVWNDGSESYLEWTRLRKLCPCASCGGEPDVLGHVIRPNVTYGPQSFILQSWQLVGSYAWQPFWADGHQSGIYSWDFLRKIGNSP